MDHDLELFIPSLEILEIEVCNILYNPGNIGKRIFSIQSYPGNSGSYDPYSVLSWKYWIVRSILSSILEIVDRTIHTLLSLYLMCKRHEEVIHGGGTQSDCSEMTQP